MGGQRTPIRWTRRGLLVGDIAGALAVLAFAVLTGCALVGVFL